MIGTTTAGPNPKIERAYMDGSERKVIATEGVFWPNGLAIDYPAGKIYWADAKHHVIESCHYDGSNRKKVVCCVVKRKKKFSDKHCQYCHFV